MTRDTVAMLLRVPGRYLGLLFVNLFVDFGMKHLEPPSPPALVFVFYYILFLIGALVVCGRLSVPVRQRQHPWLQRQQAKNPFQGELTEYLRTASSFLWTRVLEGYDVGGYRSNRVDEKR